MLVCLFVQAVARVKKLGNVPYFLILETNAPTSIYKTHAARHEQTVGIEGPADAQAVAILVWCCVVALVVVLVIYIPYCTVLSILNGIYTRWK